jgi:hypothetical protein
MSQTIAQPTFTTARQILLVTIALVLFAGCQGNAYFEPTPLANPDNAMVYLYRPAATNPGKKPLRLSYPQVMIDGNSAGFLKYNEYLALEIPPGKHEFVVTGLTREAKWEPKDRNYSLEVEPGQTYFMRFKVEFDTDNMSLDSFTGQYLIHLHRVEREEAIYEIRYASRAS